MSERRTTDEEKYQVVAKPSTLSSRELAEFLSKDGQLLLPLVELLERGEKAIDEVIDVMGRADVEAVLRMSAEQLAGPSGRARRARRSRRTTRCSAISALPTACWRSC